MISNINSLFIDVIYYKILYFSFIQVIQFANKKNLVIIV